MVLIQLAIFLAPPAFYDTYFNIFRPLAYIALLVFAYFAFGNNQRTYSGKATLTMVAVLGAILYVGFTFTAGLFTGFAKNAMETSWTGLLQNAWSYFLIIIIMEFLRSKIMTSVSKKWQYRMCFIVMAVFAFCSIDNLPNVIRFGLWQQVDYIFTALLPALVLNLWLSYSALNGGAISNLIFIGVYQAVALFLPILPDIPRILDAISLYCIVFIMFMVYDSIEWMAKRQSGIDVQYRGKRHWWVMIFPGAVLAICIMFGLGIFPVIPLAVASDSMKPKFSHGDVVYIVKTNPNDIKLGDIVQYTLGSISIVHRVVDIKYTPDGKRYFVTKGDNNPINDMWPVYDNQVVGKAVAQTPLIGWPALVFEDLKESK